MRDDDSGGSWHWWEEPPAPSVHDIEPGGDYAMGVTPIGPKSVSVYLPPTVTSGRMSDGSIPIYGNWNAPTVTDPNRKVCYAKTPYIGHSMHAAPAGDYWYGEDVNGGHAVQPNAWRNLAVINRQQLPSPVEGLAGIVRGLNNAPEDLPLEPGAPYIDVAVNAGAILAYGAQGHAQAQWITDFYLQEQVSRVSYRVIVVTRQLSMDESMYRTASGLHLINWGPGPFLRSR